MTESFGEFTVGRRADAAQGVFRLSNLFSTRMYVAYDKGGGNYQYAPSHDTTLAAKGGISMTPFSNQVGYSYRLQDVAPGAGVTPGTASAPLTITRDALFFPDRIENAVTFGVGPAGVAQKCTSGPCLSQQQCPSGAMCDDYGFCTAEAPDCLCDSDCPSNKYTCSDNGTCEHLPRRYVWLANASSGTVWVYYTDKDGVEKQPIHDKTLKANGVAQYDNPSGWTYYFRSLQAKSASVTLSDDCFYDKDSDGLVVLNVLDPNVKTLSYSAQLGCKSGLSGATASGGGRWRYFSLRNDVGQKAGVYYDRFGTIAQKPAAATLDKGETGAYQNYAQAEYYLQKDVVPLTARVSADDDCAFNAAEYGATFLVQAGTDKTPVCTYNPYARDGDCARSSRCVGLGSFSIQNGFGVPASLQSADGAKQLGTLEPGATSETITDVNGAQYVLVTQEDQPYRSDPVTVDLNQSTFDPVKDSVITVGSGHVADPPPGECDPTVCDPKLCTCDDCDSGNCEQPPAPCTEGNCDPAACTCAQCDTGDCKGAAPTNPALIAVVVLALFVGGGALAYFLYTRGYLNRLLA